MSEIKITDFSNRDPNLCLSDTKSIKGGIKSLAPNTHIHYLPKDPSLLYLKHGTSAFPKKD